ncbi:hypothetical protein ACFOZ7_22310 [Natribaculum luteum]|uniref:Uncharacterized protein n=1 Tax=Natribaculum luteum TaxID=1586232 RepID=A0ABD5P6U0_9EURY|nr:hypothetical protein [Natribaculum luteum]
MNETKTVSDNKNSMLNNLQSAQLSDDDIERLSGRDAVDPRDFHGRFEIPVYTDNGDVVIGSANWLGGGESIRWSSGVLFTFVVSPDASEEEVQRRFKLSKEDAISVAKLPDNHGAPIHG